jgi:hypothetical protein
VATIPIRDIRELASTSRSATTASTNTAASTSASAAAGTRKTRNDDDMDDDGDNDPLAQLLRDAATMRRAEQQQAIDGGESSGRRPIATTRQITSTIRNVLSTIVTIDFFFVCALLLWFLAGIVGSNIFHDDTVQIAFNGIFQQIVQPALGILMIAALSDAVLKGKEEGD